MGVVQRIALYLKEKGITKYKVYKVTGLSNGSLDKGENIGSDKCEIIFNHFTDLNPAWAMTGKGEMIKSKSSAVPLENKQDEFIVEESINQYTDVPVLLKRLVESQEEMIVMLKKGIADLETENAALKKKAKIRKSEI